MIIDCVSDLHGHYPILEGGDLLIVAGDLTKRDLPHERLDFLFWLEQQNYKKKIFIAGNHDNSLVGQEFRKTRQDGVDYLFDSGTEFEFDEPVRDLFNSDDRSFVYKKKLKIWGSPWVPYFKGMNSRCMAFTNPVDCEAEAWLKKKWALIPSDTDILITHGPAFGTGDFTKHKSNAGSLSLMEELGRINPSLHVFGHIHEGHGLYRQYYFTEKEGSMKYRVRVNASIMNEKYKPVNKPIRVIL